LLKKSKDCMSRNCWDHPHCRSAICICVCYHQNPLRDFEPYGLKFQLF